MAEDGWERPPFCDGCGATRQINWSYAFGVWYCARCRIARTHDELYPPRRASETVQDALDLSGLGY